MLLKVNWREQDWCSKRGTSKLVVNSFVLSEECDSTLGKLRGSADSYPEKRTVQEDKGGDPKGWKRNPESLSPYLVPSEFRHNQHSASQEEPGD